MPIQLHSPSVRLHLFSLLSILLCGISYLNPTQAVATGNNYYVDAGIGNDVNIGSQTSPWRTIRKAVNSIQGGSTVIIRGGIYRESPPLELYFGPAGTLGNPTIFKADTGARVIITGSGDYPPYITAADYVRIEGLWFGGTKNTAMKTQCICLGSSPIGRGKEFINNTVFNFNEGLSGGSGEYYLIQGNRFINNGIAPFQHGTYLSGDDQKGTGGASTHIIVDNNIYIGGEGYGIQGWHVVHNLIYSRNIVAGHNWGVVADGSDHLITNNFFWKEKGDPGTSPWGESLAGKRTVNYNNIFGVDAWLNTSTDAISAASQNSVSTNAFSPGMPDYWPLKPTGTVQIPLTAGAEIGELGISASALDTTIAAIKNSFTGTLASVFQDQTIQTNFNVLKNITIPPGSPLYQSGIKWFGQTVNVGPFTTAPVDQNGFWSAFRNLPNSYKFTEFDRFGNITTPPVLPSPTTFVYPTPSVILSSTPTPTSLPVLSSIKAVCSVSNSQSFSWIQAPGALNYWVQAWNSNPTPTWYMNKWLGGPTPIVAFNYPDEIVSTRVSWTNDPDYSNVAQFTAVASAYCPLPTPTITRTPAPSDKPVPTATDTPTPSSTPVPTATDTPTPSSTPVPTATDTPTPSPTNTPTPTPTDTPTPTLTPSPTPTQTPTPTFTPSPTPIPMGRAVGMVKDRLGNIWGFPIPNCTGVEPSSTIQVSYGSSNIAPWYCLTSPGTDGHMMQFATSEIIAFTITEFIFTPPVGYKCTDWSVNYPRGEYITQSGSGKSDGKCVFSVPVDRSNLTNPFDTSIGTHIQFNIDILPSPAPTIDNIQPTAFPTPTPTTYALPPTATGNHYPTGRSGGDRNFKTPAPTRVTLAGDANGDRVINGVDYIIWLNNNGNTEVTCFNSCGDFDKNRTVDTADLSILLREFDF